MIQSDRSARRGLAAALALFAAATVAVVPGAAAAKPSPQQQIKTLQAQVAKLKKQLTVANAEIARLKTAAATTTTTTTTTPACTQPCADAKGFTATVTNYHFDTPSGNPYEQPETGNVYVALDVTLTNATKTAKTVDVIDFKLTDGAGISRLPTSISACESWSSADLVPGATLGPKCLSFQAAANKPTGVSLQWRPNVFGTTYKIPLS